MHDTYYVVAQLGLNNLFSIYNYYATDYMLGTIFHFGLYYLLFINAFYLYKDGSKYILLNSQNNNTTISNTLISIQSAENCKGFSETICQLPEIDSNKF